eukprot:symbB.v1.2.033184.t1/scaffold4090.1/size75078/2
MALKFLLPYALMLLVVEAFYCRVLEDVASNLPKGWRYALRRFNQLICPPKASQRVVSEDYLEQLEHPAFLFRVEFTKKDLHEKVGFDVILRSDYIEVEKVTEGPAGRWNELKPLKALQRQDRIIEVNQIVGNSTKMVEELKRAATLRLLVVRVSEEDRRELNRRSAAKELRKVLEMPGPRHLLSGIPEPSTSKVLALHARNIEQFLAIQPITVLMVYAHWCNHCQQLTPEFRRAAELIETKDVETSVKILGCSTVEKDGGKVMKDAVLSFFEGREGSSPAVGKGDSSQGWGCKALPMAGGGPEPWRRTGRGIGDRGGEPGEAVETGAAGIDGLARALEESSDSSSSSSGLLANVTLKRFEELLAQTTGMGTATSSQMLPAVARGYFSQIFLVKHPESSIGLRNLRELRTLVTMIDHMANNDGLRALDVAVQRLKAIELFIAQGHWQQASQLEGEQRAWFRQELRAAQQEHQAETKLQRESNYFLRDRRPWPPPPRGDPKKDDKDDHPPDNQEPRDGIPVLLPEQEAVNEIRKAWRFLDDEVSPGENASFYQAAGLAVAPPGQVPGEASFILQPGASEVTIRHLCKGWSAEKGVHVGPGNAEFGSSVFEKQYVEKMPKDWVTRALAGRDLYVLNGHDEWATELIHRFGLSGLRSMSYQEWERALRRMTNHPLTVALTGVVLKVALLHRPGTLGSFFRAFPCCALEGFRRQQGELLPLPLPEETPADQELREVVEDLFGRMEPMTSSDVENLEKMIRAHGHRAWTWMGVMMVNYMYCTGQNGKLLTDTMMHGQVPSKVRLRREMEKIGVERDPQKAAENSKSWTSLGAEVDGIAGRVGSSLKFRRALLGANLQSSSEAGLRRHSLDFQSVVSKNMHSVQYNRSFACLFDEIYLSMGQSQNGEVSQGARDELLLLSCSLPFHWISQRSGVCGQVFATDASPDGGGACISTGLTRSGFGRVHSLVHEAEGMENGASDPPVVVEMFAGMGGLHQALELRGLTPMGVIGVDISPESARVMRHHCRHIMWYKNVEDITKEEVKRWRAMHPKALRVLISGGWPCVNHSVLNPWRQGANASTSMLLDSMLQIRDWLKIVSAELGLPSWEVCELYENVVMDKSDLESQSAKIGCKPTFVEAADGRCWLGPKASFVLAVELATDKSS